MHNSLTFSAEEIFCNRKLRRIGFSSVQVLCFTFHLRLEGERKNRSLSMLLLLKGAK
jgi:hypothetical protein